MAISAAASADVSMSAEWWLAEHHAYLALMLELGDHPARFDVIHNNSLHYLPIAMAPAVRTPIVTTLHTPPTPWLESAIRTRAGEPSSSLPSARTPRPLGATSSPTPSSSATGSTWTVGRSDPAADHVVWAGRIVPEKGTHLAIEAARIAGRELVHRRPHRGPGLLAGAGATPRLGGAIRYLGHLPQVQLRDVVSVASAMLVTSCWDEPYGLVVAEAMACGTPVAGFAVGALPELVDEWTGRLVPVGDAAALAEVVPVVVSLPRAAARASAQRDWAHDRMVDDYLHLYRDKIR